MVTLLSLVANPIVVEAEETQGIYLQRITVDEFESAVAYLSTGNTEEDLIVTDHITDVEVHRRRVSASEQINGPTPWIDAGWARSEILPRLRPGYYTVQVDPSAVMPSRLGWGHRTYFMPLFVVPTNPTADVVFISPTMTNTCYNDWGGKSCYTTPHNADVGFKRPGYLLSFHLKMKRVIQRLEAAGYTWDIIGEQYLEEHPDFIRNYRAAIIVEQDEYITYGMRSAYDGYLEAGGRLLILGNEVWIFQVRRNGDVYSTYKFPWRLTDPFAIDGDPSNDHLIAYEWAREDPGPDDPEIRSLGVSTWLGYRPSEPFWTAWRTSHWFFEGTTLSDGMPFRKEGIAPVGLDQIFDGVKTRFVDGLPYVDQREVFDIPDGVLILATIPTLDSRPWNCGDPWSSGDEDCWLPGTAAITIRRTVSGGVVMVIPDKTWLSDVPYDAIPTRLLDNALAAFASPEEMDVYSDFATKPPPDPVPGLSVPALSVIVLLTIEVLRRIRPSVLEPRRGRPH